MVDVNRVSAAPSVSKSQANVVPCVRLLLPFLPFLPSSFLPPLLETGRYGLQNVEPQPEAAHVRGISDAKGQEKPVQPRRRLGPDHARWGRSHAGSVRFAACDVFTDGVLVWVTKLSCDAA